MNKNNIEKYLNQIIESVRYANGYCINIIPIVDKIKKELHINIVDNSIQKTIEISSDAMIVIRSVCTDGNPPFTIQVINKNEIIYDSMENDGVNFDSVQEAEKIIQDDMESFIDIIEVEKIK